MYENNDFYPISVDGKNSNSLNAFLRKSSLLCESLMNEQSNLKNEKKKEMSQSKVADGKIFNSNVITLGVRSKMSEEKESEMVINVFAVVVVVVVVVVILIITVIFILSLFCYLRHNCHYCSTIVTVIVLHYVSTYKPLNIYLCYLIFVTHSFITFPPLFLFISLIKVVVRNSNF